jgi:hypothetical protein
MDRSEAELSTEVELEYTDDGWKATVYTGDGGSYTTGGCETPGQAWNNADNWRQNWQEYDK